MQATCPQCAAEYELAPRQISEDGVKIRCASCAHIFKAVAEPQESHGPWTLRHPTGATVQVTDISKVQLWIVEKKVFEHDEIQEGQGPWINVMTHPLLKSFFGSASQKTLTPVEEAMALEDKKFSKYDSDNFGDTLNLEPVSPEQELIPVEPILLTTLKRKAIEPPLDIGDETQSHTLLSFTNEINPIFTLSGANERGNAFESPHSFNQELIAGRFRLEEKLGEGGMGVVYKGVCLEDNSLVAVKMLRRDMESSEQATERFFREYKAIKAIASPHVVEVYEYGEEADGHKYLVMEYLEGEALDRIIKSEGPISIQRSVLYAEQIGKALNAAHDAGIIHRDLKPANVMLCRTETGEETIKILDFGIAKINDNTGSFATRTGAMIGTCNSMAPEQVLGQSIDARTDIYALGILLYYLLSGKYPFQGKTISSILYQHVHARPKPIQETLGEQVPHGLNQLMLKCLEKERSDRFRNTNALLKAINSIGIDSPQKQPLPLVVHAPRETLPKDHPRRLSAALRWRYRWLQGEMPRKIREICSWAPELFHGNFRFSNLEKEAPGILGYHLPERDRSRGFEVIKPPRLTAPALFRDILALAIVPYGDKWELIIFPAIEPRSGADSRIRHRLAGVREFFEARQVPIVCQVVDLNEPFEWHEVRNRLAIFGALLAGSLPPAFWATGTLSPLDGDDFCHWAEIAPTPFLRGTMFLLAGAGETPPIQIIRDLAEIHDVSALADPHLLCASWVAKDTQTKDAIYQSLSLVTSQLATFRAVQKRIKSTASDSTADDHQAKENGKLTTHRIMKLGRELTLTAYRVFSLLTRSQRLRLRAIYRRDFIGRGLPPMLISRLADNLKQERRRYGGSLSWLVTPQRKHGKKVFEIHDENDVLWGRGLTSDQAQARALSLWMTITHKIPDEVWDSPFWLRFCEQLLRPQEGMALIAELNGSIIEGLPSDPMNRGPQRQISLKPGLMAWVPDGGRPSVQRKTARPFVERIFNAARDRVQVVQVPTNGMGEMVSVRLKSMQKLIQDQTVTDQLLAIEVGGRVYVRHGQRFKSYSLQRALIRPRQFRVDPQAPDLKASLMLRQGRSSREHSAADQRIFCLADVWGSEEAVLVYQDSKGYTFRETVSLFRFQEHWDCTQSIFQSGAKPFVLSLTVTDQLSQKLERIVKKAQSPMQIRVDGQYPKSLRVSADGKRYGVVTVQTLADLAHYFIEKSRGKNTDYLRVNQVNLELQETAPEALSLLHARSLLMRRFSRQLLGMGFGH